MSDDHDIDMTPVDWDDLQAIQAELALVTEGVTHPTYWLELAGPKGETPFGHADPETWRTECIGYACVLFDRWHQLMTGEGPEIPEPKILP